MPGVGGSMLEQRLRVSLAFDQLPLGIYSLLKGQFTFHLHM